MKSKLMANDVMAYVKAHKTISHVVEEVVIDPPPGSTT